MFRVRTLLLSPTSWLALACLLCASPALALVQLTGTTPVVISDGIYASDSVAVYQSAPVTLLPGADIGGFLIGYQFSQIDMQGGQVDSFLHAFTQSDVLLSGGTVDGDLIASEVASIVVSGGSIGGSILAEGSSLIEIVGHGFQVDGAPVSYGPIAATSGVLTGTLAAGQGLSNSFAQGESAGATYTGSIELVAGPLAQLPALDPVAVAILCSGLAAAGLRRLRGGR